MLRPSFPGLKFRVTNNKDIEDTRMSDECFSLVWISDHRGMTAGTEQSNGTIGRTEDVSAGRLGP